MLTHDELGKRYIRKYYGVDAEIGQRVIVNGRTGIIVGFDGAHLRVLFDGATYAVICHPRWRVVYLHREDR